MKKLLSLLFIAPLAITACGTEEVERDTDYGKGLDYITIGEEGDQKTFDQDTFYQMAKEYSWGYVRTWFNSTMAEYEAVNVDTTDSVDNKTFDVKNGLAYYDMFQVDGEYNHDAAVDMFTSELLWEEFQNYAIVNGADHKTSFALEVYSKVQGKDITIADIEGFDADMGTSTDRATFLTAAEKWLAPYYREARLEAGQRMLTVNWLLTQETVTKISGSDYWKPSSRLEDFYADNTPTEWHNYTFESEKIADVTAALNTFEFRDWDDGTDTDTNYVPTTVETFDAAFSSIAESDYSVAGMGTKTSAFNAPTEVTNVAHSSNDNYRKAGWVNTGTEDEPKFIHSTGDEEFTLFYANPVELEDYHYDFAGGEVANPGDTESDLEGLLMPDNVDTATNLQEARRLYSYFKMAQVSAVQTFALNYYYSEWDLKAFDQVIYDNLESDLDN